MGRQAEPLIKQLQMCARCRGGLSPSAGAIAVGEAVLLAAARAPLQQPRQTVDHVVNTLLRRREECAAACMRRILRALRGESGGGRAEETPGNVNCG